MEQFVHPHPFDPRYGYDLDALLKVPAPANLPADFADFWRDTYAQTRATPTNVAMREIDQFKFPGYRTFEIEYDGLGGFRVGGWAVLPEKAAPTTGMVYGHGYGGRDAPISPLLDGCAAIFPCGRGFHRSARPDLPNTGGVHVLHGVESKETYSHRFCVADLWQAATVLDEIAPTVRTRFYSGGSFGGGLGALMLPWDDRFAAGFLSVPSFGNIPLRVTLDCTGSGSTVKKRFEQDPSILNVLAYFDAATASTFNRTPTIVAPALFDPAVPPPGQFAVYNALAGEKELFVCEAGHHTWPGEGRENVRVSRATRAFFEKYGGR